MTDESVFNTDTRCLKLMDEVTKRRMCKTLHYGKFPRTESLSLPVTANDVANDCLDHLDMETASKLSRQACLGPNAFIIAMVYIRRLQRKSPDYLCRISPHDLFLISMMVASKFLYDESTPDEVWTDEWAEAANVNLDELARLEMRFCIGTDWRLFVSPDEFEENLQRLECHVALRCGVTSSLTYTDLASILSHRPVLCLCLARLDLSLTDGLRALIACAAAYAAALSFTCVALFSCAAVSAWAAEAASVGGAWLNTAACVGGARETLGLDRMTASHCYSNFAVSIATLENDTEVNEEESDVSDTSTDLSGYGASATHGYGDNLVSRKMKSWRSLLDNSRRRTSCNSESLERFVTLYDVRSSVCRVSSPISTNFVTVR